ncbi:MAG: phosphoenolpyruvate--protein phosphotransferase [Acidobacteriota bacterium]|nr:MAG: phosphoenolpyruvate--protein phosphotransferase [Acidobacteriota bacterium]
MSRNSGENVERHSDWRLTGTGLASGSTFGTAYRIDAQYPTFYRIKIQSDEVESEMKRFQDAVDRSREQYLSDKRKFEEAAGREHSYIIEAHLLMLEDRHLLSEIERLVREELDSSEKALIHVSDQLLAAYHAMEDPFFRERAFDFEEVIERVLGNLMELQPEEDVETPDDLILVAPEIGLSVLARYPLEKVRGLVLTRAGRTSHVAIIARSFQIPIVSGIENLREKIRTGDTLFVNGTEGFVEICGDPLVTLQEEPLKDKREKLASRADREPCVTRDGQRIHLLANTEFGAEVSGALGLGAEGIGLFRSEYLYLRRKTQALDEAEHCEVYRSLVQQLQGRPATIRTLDIAEAEQLFPLAGEEGSAALGLRGIRLSLRNPERFRSQIRAILKARNGADLRVVLPMISSVDEVLEGRRLIREVEAELGGEVSQAPPIQVGVLVEVPAAVLTLDAIAAHVDFLAVGTNDLIQYTLAAGRVNEEMADLYNPVHPAILISLNRVVEIARRYDILALVCGEMAANPLYALVLIGLGFRDLSMTAIAIPEVKRVLRSQSAEELGRLAAELMELRTLSEVQEFIETKLEPLVISEGSELLVRS